MLLSNLVPSPDDDRDYPYIVKSYPDSADLRPFAGAIEDQGGIGSCTANSVVSACELILQRRKNFIDLSRLFNYYTSRYMESRIGEEGAVLRDAVKAAQKLGIPSERKWPYDTSKENSQPTVDVYAAASGCRVSQYERIPDDDKLNGIRSAVSEGCPVVIAMPVTDGFVKSGVQGGEVVGNHAMCVVGYTPECLIVENSWGSGWGDGGYGYIPNDQVSQIFEAWVIRDFAPGWVPSHLDLFLMWWDNLPVRVKYAGAFGLVIGFALSMAG